MLYGMGGGTHEHAADWDTGGGRSSAGFAVQKGLNPNMASISVLSLVILIFATLLGRSA